MKPDAIDDAMMLAHAQGLAALALIEDLMIHVARQDREGFKRFADGKAAEATHVLANSEAADGVYPRKIALFREAARLRLKVMADAFAKAGEG